MLTQITIPVSNAAELLAQGYTTIELWRSMDGGGVYELITDAADGPAVLLSAKPLTTFRMGGKVLRVAVNGIESTVNFSSALQYWTAAQVAGAINDVVPGIASVYQGMVRLATTGVGLGQTLAVTYCEAPDLFSSGLISYGRCARIRLADDKLVYIITDPVGASSYRYKWRFSAEGALPATELSSFVYPSASPVDEASVSFAIARFLDSAGRPAKRTVVVACVGSPTRVGNYIVGDELPQTYTADETGFLQIPMVRGLRMRVGIEGTTLVREFTVPNAASFDLLTAMTEAPDTFTVQVPPPLLNRRSM